MKKEWKDLLEKLSDNEELSRQLKDLYKNDPENFAENCLKILNENGITFLKDDQSGQEISLQQLEQVAGGRGSNEEEIRKLLEAMVKPKIVKQG